jgi:hypothetical protein
MADDLSGLDQAISQVKARTPDYGPSDAPGMLAQGNIDLAARPIVKNPDGSISTVRSISVNADGREVLIPTVSDDGRLLSNEEAIDTFRRTGRNLGAFGSPADATSYALALHERQAQQYLPSSLDAAIAQVQGEKQAHTAATVRNNLQFATSAVPDQEARVRHLARFLDQPLETVRSDTDTAHAQAVLKATDADRMAVEHPATAAALGDPSTARMLHDDIPNVAATESIVGKLTKLRDYVFGSSRDPNDPSMAGDIYRSAVGGLSTTAKYLNLAGGVVPIGLDRLKESVTGQHTTELEDPYFASMVAPADANQQNAQLPEHAPIYRKASAAVGQLASMLAQAASTGGGAPAVEGAQTMQQFLTEALAHTTKAMMLPAASQGMQTGENVQNATGDTGAAIRAGLAQYLVSTAQGLAPLSATGGLATRVTTGAISGVAGGQAGRIAMNAVLPEGMQQPFDPEQAVVDSIIGGGMGGVLGPRTPPEWLKAVRQTYVDSAKAEHAAQAMGLLQELSAVATAGKFRERDQQAFHEFMSEANGPDLYVDARTFAQTLDQAGITAEQLQAKLPDAAAQMREGLQSDGMVRIPMADYATHIAGGPADAALLPHLRTDPEGMTFDEAQKFTTEQAGKMSEQATQLATGEDQSAAAAFRASGDEVQKKVKAQLDEAGHFPSPVNDAYASLHRAFFDTLAARLGITPEEAHAQFPLEVGSEALGTGAMGQTATVRSGKETLEAFGLDPNGKYNTRDIAAALEARQRALYGKIEPTDRSSEAADRIANWMAEEVRFEMQHPRKSGVGWYSTKFQRALDKFADAFPELKDDAAARAIPGIKNAKDARGLLTALIAVTSDGQKVVPNFRMAADLYRAFRETGTFSTERGHARMDSIEGNVALIQELHTRLGASEMRKYLLQEATVSDLRKIAKAKGIEFKTEYQAHVKLPMAAVVFGPKLGAFYANLMGAHGYLTMDRWWSRTFNRYRGTLLQAPTADGLARIKELMGHPEWSDDQALAATVEPRNAYAKKNFKNGTELEKAANTVYKAGFENLEDAPFNATDRTFMLGAVARAQEILAAEGRKMSVADIQAVLWYYEKRLYGELGARQSADVSYEEAAQRVTAEHLSAGESGRPGAPGAGEGASGLDAEGLARPGDEGSTPGLDPFEPNAGSVDTTLGQGGTDRLGEISFGKDIQSTPSRISLFKTANLSTFLHESGHFFLEIYADLAGRADAPPEIKADLQKVLDWFGVKDLDAWKALTPEQKEPFHEQFARGFEARLMEGNAPSAQLSGLFARFRSWLVNVYKSLANLHVDLSDEVRGVMDRMVASDEAIRQQEAVRGMEAMFTEKPEGMSDADYAAYKALGEKASEKASTDLQDKSLRDMKWLSNAKSKAVRELQAQAKDAREAVQAEVTKEVDANPAFQAKAFMDEATASTPESKAQAKQWQAQRGVAEDAFRKEERERAAEGKKGLEKGQAIAKAKRAIDNAVEARMLEWEAQHPKPALDRGDINHDIVAERFGFSSGDEMLQAIHAAGNRADIIKAMTDQRMLQQYGDLTTPEGIQRAAEQAIHNDVRARFIATELNALVKATGSPALLARAARDAAHAAIAAKKVRDLRPDQYTAAEGKASRESTAALKKGDIPVAAAKKRAQLLSNALAKAALEARAEITKGVAYLKKFDKASIRANLSQDFLSQIDSLLERYDLRQATGASIDKKASLRSFVQARLNAGEMPIPVRAEMLLPPAERAAYEAQIASRDAEGNLVYAEPEEQIKLLAEALDRSARMPHQEMTVESFRGLVDTVKTLEHLARQQNKLLTAETERSYQEIRDEMAGSIEKHARNSGKGTRTATSLAGRALQAVREFGAAHIKAATWARIMDGGKDNGAMWRYLIRPANDAATFETTRRAEATQALSKILRPILDKVSSVDKMGKGKFFPELGTSLNWQERFAMALNYGNEGNLQRLLGGGIAGVKQRLTPEQIIPVLRSLTAKEWHAVQAVWDHLETYRPEVGALERRMNGAEPDWVEPRPFKITTADGETITLRGGYFPIVYDPRGSLHAQQHSDAADAKQMMKAAYSAAVTQHGFTKNRAEEVNGRPLMLSLQGLYRGVNDVIHDLAWREWVRDANKLLRSKTIDAQIRDHYGPEVKRQLEKWRDDIVTGTRRLDHQIERAAGFLRQGVSAAGLTFNIMSAAMQPLGLTQSIVRIGPQWVGKGLAKYIGAPIEATREANEKSEWMANRMRTRFRELNELANAVHGQTKPRELMGRYGYWMMLRAQQMVDVPTWHGAYEKAIAAGENEHDAVRLADQAVKDAQGGGEEVDQAGIERGGPLVKLFTTFYGFMNTAANLGYMQLKTERSAAKLAVQMLLLYTVPAILGDLMKDALTPGDSGKWDEEHVATTLGKSQLSYLFGLVAFGRELGGMVSGQDYTGPAGLRVFADAYKLEKQAQQGEFDDAFRKAVVAEMGDLFGLPGAQINKTITGAEALDEGETDNPAALLLGYQQPH